MQTLRCPACGSTSISFDFHAAVSFMVSDGQLVAVTHGGVLGVNPDQLFCHGCSETTELDAERHEQLLEAFDELVTQALPKGLHADLSDGVEVFPIL